MVDVYLVPVAAEDDRPFLSFDADVMVDRGDAIGGDEFIGPSLPVVSGHPRNVPFNWACEAPARRPACGRFEPDGGEGNIVIPVRLERGWGRRLYVGDDNHDALAGVRVFADGVPVGITGASGMLCLGGQRPERLSFVYADWINDGDGDVEPDGTFEDDRDWVSVFLVPPHAR